MGLAAHGVGIGSFVYLRRIFEDLVQAAHLEAVQDPGWNDEVYIRGRMDEKIGLLQHHLPSFLVQNRSLYSILSKGIHELSEQECLQYFSSVHMGIELILDEKIEQEERRKKIERASHAIADVRRKL